MGQISGDILRILWVKANKVLPVHSGGDIRSYNIARQLARQHQLAFLSYYDGPHDLEYERQLSERLPGAISIATGKSEASTLARGMDYLGRLSSPLPYAVGRFASKPVQAAVERLFAERKFDVAICDFLDAAVNFPAHLTTTSVLFQHNVETEIWRRHAATAANPLKKRIYAIEFKKMLRYEQQMVRKFDHVIAVSEHDRGLMEAWVEGSRITVVPTGVDLEQYKPDFERQANSSLVVFVGAMDWEPNVDAMEHFCRDIWPAVLARVPGAKMRIVGRNPDERVRALAASSIEITGRVPSVAEHLHEAEVVIVPLRIGGGTRLKIYEAMAAGKAVVSTTVGAEGLDVRHGKDIVLADSAESFSAAVAGLLQDGALREKYGRAAAATAAHYDWAIIGEKFGRTLEFLTGKIRNSALTQTGVEVG
jgi:glycosyltransferase involved in cell wall biosynthesis